MVETNFVESVFYNQKFRIHGHLSHDLSPSDMLRWFIYLIEDIPCNKAIVDSTTKPTSRWSAHKSSCNNGPSHSTGLSKHFTLNWGYPNDIGREKKTLRYTLIDYIDVSQDDLQKAGHVKGPKCWCSECNRLKDLEDSWILKLGTFYGDSGLNTRDEIQSKTRYKWGRNINLWKGQGRICDKH